MEITRLAQQFTAPMDHRFDKIVAQFRRLAHAPFKGLVVMADEFHVDANFDFAHKEEIHCRPRSVSAAGNFNSG